LKKVSKQLKIDIKSIEIFRNETPIKTKNKPEISDYQSKMGKNLILN